MLIFKKEKQVVELAREHADNTVECVRGAGDTVKAYLLGNAEVARAAAVNVDRLEALADDQRRMIGDLLYSGAYLPSIREDVYHVIDSVDVVAGTAESCCDFFMDQGPEIPSDLGPEFVAMMDLTLETVEELRKTLRSFFKPKGKLDKLRQRAEAVGRLESKIDEIEGAVTRKIFASSLEMGHKMHLRSTIVHIVRISDRAEDASDQVELVSMKSLV